jgi:hypothetical protein
MPAPRRRLHDDVRRRAAGGDGVERCAVEVDEQRAHPDDVFLTAPFEVGGVDGDEDARAAVAQSHQLAPALLQRSVHDACEGFVPAKLIVIEGLEGELAAGIQRGQEARGLALAGLQHIHLVPRCAAGVAHHAASSSSKAAGANSSSAAMTFWLNASRVLRSTNSSTGT